MSMTIVKDIPRICDEAGPVSIRTSGSWAIASREFFSARFSLPSGATDWLVQHTRRPNTEAHHSSRPIRVTGSDLWIGANALIVVEIRASHTGGLSVTARAATTGLQIWHDHIPMPDSAEWAETAPAWPGAATEEIDAFIADDPARLVVCLMRRTRRSQYFGADIVVSTLPPDACQLDAIRFDPETGARLWSETFPDVSVGILEREHFRGIWAHDSRVGAIDFETGTNALLQRFPHTLGWPIWDGCELAVPWFSNREVGVEWIDRLGNRTRGGSWKSPRTREVGLHPTDSGLSVHADNRILWWLGKDALPRWSTRVKPYIYRVHRSVGTDVFVGTDGNGGRLFGFDADTGTETLNLKPALGGVGDLAKVPGGNNLVATYRVSKSYSVPLRLLVLQMNDRSHRAELECDSIVGLWASGAVCLIGGRLATVELPPSGS